MIPPVVPGHKEEQQKMVDWKNTFNMRQLTLTNLAASYSGGRNGSITHFMSGGCITSPAKSLDLLRRNLQNAINKDIDNIIRKYLEKFFQPAISNIKMNLGKNSVNEELIKTVCQQMLEDAKIMYTVSVPSVSSRDSSPYTYSDSEIFSTLDTRVDQLSPIQCKRKESDTDSDTNCVTDRKHHKPVIKAHTDNLTSKLTEKREGRKWDPDRVTSNSLFIMGTKANKVLGFGQTRGRLYVRHPNILRYPSDSEDKEWLSAHSLMPPSGGKAYLMLMEDVQELALSDDYRNSPNLQLQDLCGFEAPSFMISKVKTFMENVRTDKKRPVNMDIYDYQQNQAVTPLTGPVDVTLSTHSDTCNVAGSAHSFTTANTKEVTVTLSIPDPGDLCPNNSFTSRVINRSRLCSSNSISQSMVAVDLTHNKEASGNTESSSNVEKFKRRRILDHLISTHGTIDSS